MSSEALLPPRVTRMGEALRPLLHKVREGTARSTPAESERVTLDLLREHLHDLEMAVNRIVDAVDGMMNEVVAAEDAGDPEIYRAVARLESRVDDLQDGRARLLHAVADDRYEEGRGLLADTYLHLLEQIETWLEELVDFIADPMAAGKRKGLPTSGYVEVTIALTIDAPPQLEEFTRWVDRERRLLEEDLDGDPAGKVVVHLKRSGARRVPPPHLKRTGEATRPLLQRLPQGLPRTLPPAWLSPKVTGNFISSHLYRLADVGDRLEDAADSLMRDVIAASRADDAEIRRTLAPLASCIDELAVGYEEACAANARGAMIEGRRLLVSGYRHLFDQLTEWLRGMIDVIEDPLAGFDSKALAAGYSVGLPIRLRLTVPPAFGDLENWGEDLRLRDEANAAFWGTAFAAALGAWIGCGLFDD